ncbi:MAG TPA: Ig-like domain-containing protein [Candidatus Limnocylindria bacterium]|nr:Ig-like domain-containing protein [Candidatus Limnocylindria bacterium]
MRSVLLRFLVVILVGGALLTAILYVASTVDSRPPAVVRIELTQHLAADEAVALTTTSVEVAFSEAVDHASAQEAFRIDPPLDGSFSWSGTTLTFTPTDPLPLESAFTVAVDAGVRDTAGNPTTAATDPFAFTTVGSPTVASTTPADGDDAVALDAPVTVVFSTLMDTVSVESALRLTPQVPVTLRWSGETLTVMPDGPMEPDTTYRLEIDTTATDLAGTALDEALELAFTTARAGLDVVTVVPADGVEGIAVTTSIAIVFDRPLDPASVDEEQLAITPELAGSLDVLPLPGAAGLAETGERLLRFTPSGPLPVNTTYEVALAPGLRSTGGGELTEPIAWTFTTGAPSATLSNQVVFATDRSGVTNVWAMNPDGTNQRQVTAELSPVTDYAVAPDGRSLVVGDGATLVEQLVDGRDRRLLTDEAHLEFDPAYAPDGRTIAFGRADATTGAGLGIWLRGVAGGEAAALTPPDELTGDATPSPSSAASPLPTPLLREPAYAPDGAALAYVDTAGRVAMVELPADRLTTAPVAASGPLTWLPDSSGVLIVGTRLDGPIDEGDGPRHEPGLPVQPLDPAGTNGVEVLRLFRGSQRAQATSFADGAARLAVDGNGRVASIVLDRAGSGGQIWISTAGGGAHAAVGANGTLHATWVAFTPERGTLIVARATEDGVPLGIFLVDLDTGRAERLTADGSRPRWLP